MNPTQTKAHLAELLRTGHAVTVRWDCGGDESFVYTSVDGQEVEARYDGGEDFAYGLDQFLTDELGLPGVGEFSMTGNGRFFLENQSVGIEYRSEATVYWDYEEELDEDFYARYTDEELKDMGLKRPDAATLEARAAAADTEDTPDGKFDQEMSEDYSGKRILFEVAG